VYVVDVPTVGGTFFQFNGDAKINPSLSAGFLIQVGFDRGARSHQVSEFNDDGADGANGAGDTSILVTLANWYLDHKELGRLTVGRANTATAGITGIDLGGAGVIANVNVGYWNRSFGAFGTGVNWADLLGGGTVNGSTLSRGNVINYTAPTFGGFSASAAWGEDDVWDVALRYAGEHAGFRVAAGIGYSENASGLGELTRDSTGSPGPEPTMVKGSASILHVATGLYLSGAYIKQDNDLAGRDDTTLWYVNGGIAKNWTGLGNTVLYGEYARVDDGIQSTTNSAAGGSKTGASLGADASSEATVWGLGIVQHIDAAAMEVFLSYRHYDGEVSGFSVTTGTGDDAKTVTGGGSAEMDVVMGGARIRF
jgi:hypothetical protein